MRTLLLSALLFSTTTLQGADLSQKHVKGDPLTGESMEMYTPAGRYFTPVRGPGGGNDDPNGSGNGSGTGSGGSSGGGNTGGGGTIGGGGSKGATGATGAQGPKGDQGIPGQKGGTGAPGLPGAKGDKGDKGDKGEAGTAAAKGATGATGATGAAGATGAKGDKGEPGVAGSKGAAGATGATGAKGDKGDRGEKGEPGVGGGGSLSQAFGSLYNIAHQVVPSNGYVTWDNAGVHFNTTPTTAGLTFTQSGVYLVNLSLVISNPGSELDVFQIYLNGVPTGISYARNDLLDPIPFYVTIEQLLTVKAGDVLSVHNDSSSSLILPDNGPSINAKLTAVWLAPSGNGPKALKP